MFPYQPLTRSELSRWLRHPQAWISVAILGGLVALSLVR